MTKDNLKRIGANFLDILNNLKRDTETAARELNINESLLKKMLSGETNINEEIIKRASRIWPVNKRDFFVIEDDAPDGVLVMKHEESKNSTRILQRGGVDYYEYRDTAMSRVSMFRPEWIKELVIVDDKNPHNPNLAWNNGHFLHQFTYFIGPVNFYWDLGNNKRFCAEMSTGDSMHISPFVPHTFATRKNNKKEKGIILAVTYGGMLAGDAQNEISVLGSTLSNEFLIDYSSLNHATSSLIKEFREQLSLPQQSLALISGINLKRIINLENNQSLPTNNELIKLAKNLRVSIRDLIPKDVNNKQVVVLPYKGTRSWNDSENCSPYVFVELAHTTDMPYTKGLELTIHKSNVGQKLKVTSHQYIYNVGKTPVTLTWKNNKKEKSIDLQPDDSAYMKPSIEHEFKAKEQEAKLLIVRTGGHLVGDTQHELSLLDKRGLDRIAIETQQWYNPEGKR